MAIQIRVELLPELALFREETALADGDGGPFELNAWGMDDFTVLSGEEEDREHAESRE